MTAKTRSISDLVSDLQEENDRLHFLEKLFQQACKKEFGYDMKTIHRMLEKQRLYEERKAAKQGQQSTFPQSEM